MRNTGMFMLLLAPAVLAETANQLTIDVMPAEAKIAVSDSRSKALPDLSFAMSLGASCAAPATVSGLSLNVADVRLTWTGEQASAGVRADVEVPSRQLGPVTANFCMLEGGDVAPRLIEAVLTAQLALSCTIADRVAIDYRSFPLDVYLSCDQPEEPASVGEPDAADASSS